MATKQLFQILLRNRDGIKQGITKVQDIVTEYLSTTGARAISPDERFTINKVALGTYTFKFLTLMPIALAAKN